MKKIRNKKLDTVFSLLVRGRVNDICENCGKATGLQDCAHIVSRRSVATRWHPLNAVDLCRSHHMYFTERPFDWVDWCKEKFGEKLIDELRLVANHPVKWTAAVRMDIFKHYEHELEQMQAARDSGILSRLDFTKHEIMHDFSE